MDEFNEIGKSKESNDDETANKTESAKVSLNKDTETKITFKTSEEENNSSVNTENKTENNIPKICINKKSIEPGKPFAEQEIPKITPVTNTQQDIPQQNNQQQIPPYNPQQFNNQQFNNQQYNPNQYNQQVPPYNPQQPQQYGQYQQPYNNTPYQMPPYNIPPNNMQIPPQYDQRPPQTPPLYQPYQQYGEQSPYQRPMQPQLNPEQRQMQKRASKAGIIIFCLFIVSFVISFIIFAFVNSANNDETSTPASVADNNSSKNNEDSVVINIPIQDKPDLDDEFYVDKEKGLYTTIGVNERVSPSVVGIECYDDTKLYPVTGGSGIILSDDGYIITNSHVVEGMKMYKVILSDKKEYKATLIGNDKKTDLAVLKISAKNLPTADFGNSEQIKIGEQVAVIGNPGVFSNTVSYGYVSAVNRSLDDFENGIDLKCIQTDAAVNPGNSGGPLVNMYGQVIGIVSSKYISEGYENIGFAISINEAIPVVEDIISQGFISDRVKLGIKYVPLSQEDAGQLNVVPGLLVREIDKNCDVSKSGLLIDDIITAIDDVTVYDAQTIKKALSGKKPGDEITLHVYRVNIAGDSENLEIKTTLMQDKELS